VCKAIPRKSRKEGGGGKEASTIHPAFPERSHHHWGPEGEVKKTAAASRREPDIVGEGKKPSKAKRSRKKGRFASSSTHKGEKNARRSRRHKRSVVETEK